MEQKQSQGGNRTAGGASGQSDHLKTAGRLAQEFKVGEKTIRRDAKFAEAVDQIVASCGEKARHLILSRDAALTRNQVIRIARMKPHEQQQLIEQLSQTGRLPKRRAGNKRATITLSTDPKTLVEILVQRLDRTQALQVARFLVRALGAKGAEKSSFK